MVGVRFIFISWDRILKCGTTSGSKRSGVNPITSLQ